MMTALPTVAQQPATIIGDDYQAQGSVDGFGFGPLSFTADSIERDLDTSFTIKWVDENSFDINTLGPGADFDFILTLSDLDFKTSTGQPVSIASVVFNENDSTYATFFASPANPSGASRPVDPDVGSTANSVTVRFGAGWSDQLSSDLPTLRFDVQVVPEPSTFLMSLVGLSAYVFIRRRK